MSYKDRFKKQLSDLSIYKDPKVREHGMHFDSNRERTGWSDKSAYGRPQKETTANKKTDFER